MATETLQVLVNQDSPRSDAEGTPTNWKGTKRGEGCVIDFYTAMALEQRLFQVRAGSVTTPLVGDIVITDQVGEMAVEAKTGFVVLPTEFNWCFRLAAATLFEVAVKSRPWTTAITFTADRQALNCYIGGPQAASRVYVDAAGGVDVGANESLTVDRLHYDWAQRIAAGAYTTTDTWEPIAPPPVVGRSILYVQIGADTTGPSYYATLHFIELATVQIS